MMASRTLLESMSPKGDPRDPMTEDEIAVKFTALGGDVIGKDQCQEVAEIYYEHGDRRQTR